MSFITKFSDFCNGFELQYGKSPSHEPFAVINADDYYGKEAFIK